ncbi:MAG: DUF998 domain-containing protein [Actinobacteria bacterium]|nr:DUF998 domain-containing protein [Actinomycetota bacterium]
MDQAAAVRTAPSATSESRALLACGVVAGPLFIVVALVQAFTRSEFDLSRHPLSLLSLGDLGWIQIANFVVAGLLFSACAVGMRRAMDRSSGGTWVPRLIGVFGLSLIAGGVFLSDPAFGFPPGTPPGTPEELSWHSIVHGIAPVLGFLALVAASFVFARHYSRVGERGWAVGSALVGVVVLALSAWPNLGGDPEGRFGPLWVAMVLGFAWASIMAVRLLRGGR